MKATKFCEIFPLLLTVCTVVKSKRKISKNFVAFSKYMNFSNISYLFLALFQEVYPKTVLDLRLKDLLIEQCHQIGFWISFYPHPEQRQNQHVEHEPEKNAKYQISKKNIKIQKKREVLVKSLGANQKNMYLTP